MIIDKKILKYSKKLYDIYKNTDIITHDKTLPLIVDFSHGVIVKNPNNISYNIDCIDKDTNTVIYSSKLKPKSILSPFTTNYINWSINITSESTNILTTTNFDINNKLVLIEIHTDIISNLIIWLDDILEFKKLHNCSIVCKLSNHTELIKDEYNDITFVDNNYNNNLIYTKYIIEFKNEIENYKLNSKSKYISKEILGLNE